MFAKDVAVDRVRFTIISQVVFLSNDISTEAKIFKKSVRIWVVYQINFLGYPPLSEIKDTEFDQRFIDLVAPGNHGMNEKSEELRKNSQKPLR